MSKAGYNLPTIQDNNISSEMHNESSDNSKSESSSIDHIQQKLRTMLQTEDIHVIDNSVLHSNHYSQAGAMPTHIQITVSCKNLKELERIDMHRKINEVLKNEFELGLHAVAIKIS